MCPRHNGAFRFSPVRRLFFAGALMVTGKSNRFTRYEGALWFSYKNSVTACRKSFGLSLWTQCPAPAMWVTMASGNSSLIAALLSVLKIKIKTMCDITVALEPSGAFWHFSVYVNMPHPLACNGSASGIVFLLSFTTYVMYFDRSPPIKRAPPLKELEVRGKAFRICKLLAMAFRLKRHLQCFVERSRTRLVNRNSLIDK